MRAKDKLTELKHNEGRTASSNGDLGEGTNPIGQLCIATHLLLQLGLHGLLL